MLKKILLFIIAGFISTTALSQDDWEFSNSTPQNLVKSHIYFVESSQRDLDIAIFTFEENKLSVKAQKRAIKDLYSIIKKLNLDIEGVSNRRKGITKDDKYVLFANQPNIYLIRDNRKWYYSIETIKSIPSLYNKYVLKVEPTKQGEKFQKEIINDIPDSVNFEFNLSTPYNAILSHLMFLSDSLYNPTKAAKCINFGIEDTANVELLAIKLNQIFLGAKKHVFSISVVSTDSFYTDSLGHHIYYPNPNLKELFLEKVGDNWLYSRSTSKLIASVHEDMYSNFAEDVFAFSDKFKGWAGAKRYKNVGVLYLWQVYMILYFLIIAVFVIVFNRILIKPLMRKFISRNRWYKNIYPLYNALIILILIKLGLNYGPSFEFPLDINHIFFRSLALLRIFFWTLFAFYSVNLIIVASTKEDSFDNRFGLIFFLGLLVKMIIFVTSLIFIIDALEYNLINVLAGLSIGGFALALGAQDTVKNFFGSIMIFADDSFSVGDWIDNGSVSGTVEKVGLRSTRVRTFYNSIVTVPNSNLADNNIDNMGKRVYRRYKGSFIIKYNTDPKIIEEFTLRIKKVITESENTRKDFYMVYIDDFTKYGIEILVYVFFIVPTWDREMEEKHKLIGEILKIKNELNIEFVSLTQLEEED